MKDALGQAFVMGRSMGKQGLVAWGVFEGNNLHDMFFTSEEAKEMAELKGSHAKVRPLYDAPQQQEPHNFCPRCGKRTKDIHTCTPPEGGHQ